MYASTSVKQDLAGELTFFGHVSPCRERASGCTMVWFSAPKKKFLDTASYAKLKCGISFLPSIRSSVIIPRFQ